MAVTRALCRAAIMLKCPVLQPISSTSRGRQRSRISLTTLSFSAISPCVYV
jgi:hypothetical protein